MAAVHDCGFELVDHQFIIHIFTWFGTISLFLFPNMKKKNNLAGNQYRTDDEVISTVEDFFEDQDESLYTTGIHALQHRWKKCVDCKGDHVEK